MTSGSLGLWPNVLRGTCRAAVRGRPAQFTEVRARGLSCGANDRHADALLKHEGDLPDLKGMTLELVGIGDTAPPQHQVSIAQRNKLIAIWTAVAEAGGAKVGVDSAQRDGAAPTHVPPVQLVPTQ
jgi:OOP family OmpA-OmpF porin